MLDLGCRDGALTQAYASGNEVVGVDADREALAAAEVSASRRAGPISTSRCRSRMESFDVVVAGEARASS